MRMNGKLVVTDQLLEASSMPSIAIFLLYPRILPPHVLVIVLNFFVGDQTSQYDIRCQSALLV